MREVSAQKKTRSDETEFFRMTVRDDFSGD